MYITSFHRQYINFVTFCKEDLSIFLHFPKQKIAFLLILITNYDIICIRKGACEIKKIDIIQENLCIKKIITVIQGKNEKHHKLLTVKSRHSDAFVYVISGSCTYRFDDKTEFKVTAGDVFYLPYQSIYIVYID